ncbi:MAG: hypothetical protein KY463_12255, partial [Actinobacteria bacterium]|nr:hypothetical protein [Actinomycetota bacterium]
VRPGGTISVERATGYSEEVLARLGTFPLDADLPIAAVIRTGAAVLIDSIPALPEDTWRDVQEVAAASGEHDLAALVERAKPFCWVSNMLASDLDVSYVPVVLDAPPANPSDAR